MTRKSYVIPYTMDLLMEHIDKSHAPTMYENHMKIVWLHFKPGIWSAVAGFRSDVGTTSRPLPSLCALGVVRQGR